MYPVSDLALQVIRSDDRSFQWIGTITLSDGTVHNFDMSNIVQGSGSLRQSCNAPGIGEAASAELSIQMFLDDVSIESLKGAVINLTCLVISRIDVETWGDAHEYPWRDISGAKWGEEIKTLSTDVPLGVFNIKQAKRAMDSIRITAYDNMQKLDKAISDFGTSSRTPYSWLTLICSRCDITLGMTSNKVASFPNGSKSLTFADSGSNQTTYRDVVKSIAAALCATAIMDRKGRLTLMPCVSDPVVEYAPSNRFSSEFGDYKTYYTGMYAQYQVAGTQEYYRNVAEEQDTGSIIDLGNNSFLQISNDSTRKSVVQAICDKFKDYAITPFEISIPNDPTLELMDMISFTGNHAPPNAQAPITDITMSLNGDISIRCEVEETAEGLLRADKTLSGGGISGSSEISGVSYGSGGFWLNIASYPSSQTVITQETATTSLDVDITIDNTRTQIVWTGAYTLSVDATVTAKVYVDSDLIYTISDDQKAGTHTLNVTTGHEMAKKGKVNFRVSILASDGASITMDANTSRLTVIGYGWGEVAFESGEGLTETEELIMDLIEMMDAEFEDPDGNIIEPDTPEFEELVKKLAEEVEEELAKEEEEEQEEEESGEQEPEDPVEKDTPDDEEHPSVAKVDPNTGQAFNPNIGHNAPGIENAVDGWKPNKYNTAADVVSSNASTANTNINPVSGNLNGQDYYTTTDSGNPTEPYKIKVTTNPTKNVYESGETIDTTGMVVTAYTILGAVWTNEQYPDGTVPLSELVISPTKAP